MSEKPDTMREKPDKWAVLMQVLKIVEMDTAKAVSEPSPETKAQVFQIFQNSQIINQAPNSVINIDSIQFVGLSAELDKSLQEFSDTVNKQIQIHEIPPEQVGQIQQSLVELGKEAEGIESEKQVGIVKKTGIKAKLVAVGHRICKYLPKTAETIALFTPLAPFAKLIGEGIEELVKEVQKEG